MCPRCGSIERYRTVLLYLRTIGFEGDETRKRVLEIAPTPWFSRYCEGQRNLTFVSCDLGARLARVKTDLTQLAFGDALFDLVVCLHVLEHIPEDRRAIEEIGRVLKPGGFGLVMVPILGAQTFEDPDLDKSEYARVYGQADHVRICGMDYGERIRAAGLAVQLIDVFGFFAEPVLSKNALRGGDRWLFRVSRQEDGLPARQCAT